MVGQVGDIATMKGNQFRSFYFLFNYLFSGYHSF